MENEKLVNQEEIKDETVQAEEAKVTVANENEENFEQMLEESLGNIQEISVGDKVEGDIINITDSLIFVSLGGKRDAHAEKNDYLNKEGELDLEVGQQISGYVVKVTDDETVISKSLVSVNKRVLEEAFEEKIPVQGKVSSIIKGGFNIDINGVRAFCPLSQIDLGVVSETKKYIGTVSDFLVIDFQQNGRNIVVSRRKLFNEERKKKKEIIDQLMAEDVIVEGAIKKITSKFFILGKISKNFLPKFFQF